MPTRRSSRMIGHGDQTDTAVIPEQPPSKRQRVPANMQPKLVIEKLVDRPTLSADKYVADPGHSYVSPYEAAIQKNIKEKMEMLKMLQIDAIKEEVKASVTEAKPAKKTFKKVKSPVSLTPSRRSLRLSGRDPAGAPLPERPASPEPQPERRKLGRQTATGASAGYSTAEDMVKFMADIRSELAKQEHRKDIPVDRYTQALSGLEVTENTWTKVTSQRITTMAFCPLREKLVVAAGDKKGILGLWDVSRGDDGVHMLEAHTRHIMGLSFAPDDSGTCYTTSYDGITRCLDLERREFDQVYATPDSDLDMYLNHHTHAGDGCLLIAQSDGQLVRRDLRAPAPTFQRLSTSCLRHLSVHPSRLHCLAVVERPSTVSLWDLRHVKGPRSALQRLPLPRACSSAVISRRDGDHLAALSSDDTIRLYQGVNQGQLDAARVIRHDNRTGRWLTTFKPTWLPGSDDLFLVGSMQQPRRLEVYDRSGPVYHLLMGQEMQSICSTIVCHPSEPAIAGGNSSGKVYVFK